MIAKEEDGPRQREVIQSLSKITHHHLKPGSNKRNKRAYCLGSGECGYRTDGVI